jgi:hypothetical protein
MTITTEELPISAEYLEASLRFREIWIEYLHREKEAEEEIVNMFKILVDEGYSKTKAIQKIKEDHSDLKGFSTRTIYRQLPDEMKDIRLGRPNLSHDKLGETNNNNNKPLNYDYDDDSEKDENVINITTTYDLKDAETNEQSFVVDLPPPEPEVQDPKIIPFIGQLPKPVLRLAEKIELSPTKIKMIAEYSNKSILKDHPKIQKNLVEDIAPLTMDQTRIEISQAIRDLETGAIQKIEDQNSYVRDYDLREKIPKKVDRPKHPIEYFLELMDKIDEILYIGTGHKITRDDDVSSYEPKHIDATQKHRFAMLNEMDGRQINMLEDKFELLQDLTTAFTHEIDEVWKNKK